MDFFYDKHLWSPSGLHYWQFSFKRLIHTKTKDNMYAFISEFIIFVLHFMMNSDTLYAPFKNKFKRLLQIETARDDMAANMWSITWMQP